MRLWLSQLGFSPGGSGQGGAAPRRGHTRRHGNKQTPSLGDLLSMRNTAESRVQEPPGKMPALSSCGNRNYLLSEQASCC